MRITATARRLRVYIGDSDQWRGLPLWRAILDLLKREGLAGAILAGSALGLLMIAGSSLGKRLLDRLPAVAFTRLMECVLILAGLQLLIFS